MKQKILKLISEIDVLLKNKPLNENSAAHSGISSASSAFTFDSLKTSNYHRQLEARIEQLKECIFEIGCDYKKNKSKLLKFVELFNTATEINANDAAQLALNLTKIKQIIEQLNLSEEHSAGINAGISAAINIMAPKNIPGDIKAELELDIKEMNLAFNAGCYRASIILCGRVLETCLHRKYYEATQNDLLEKSPGIGLGNLIAKIAEKGITLDPGLAQQIHLVNNVRIFSVHKKKELFVPSKQQTYALILYTMDVIERLF